MTGVPTPLSTYTGKKWRVGRWRAVMRNTLSERRRICMTQFHIPFTECSHV
jgi:hypothetical protein